ncbi:MAG: FHA domain-containing protein [Schlesneria sp.]
MPITLAVHGRPPITVGADEISLGSDPSCEVSFSDIDEIKPNHAVIREIGGKWLIEACEADSLIVGNAKPARLHYLKPGDVIRLTENSPPVTFEPIEEFLPVSDGPDAGAMSLLLDDDDSLSSGSMRRPRKPSSGTIPATGTASKGQSGTGKPPSSGTIPATKPPSSSTLRSVKTPAEGVSSTKRSDGKNTSSSAKRPGSSGQIPARKPTEDEFEANLPTLQRTSSWDDLPEAPRRRRSSDKDEMKWIMMIVGRAVAGGLAVLFAWLILSFLWKSLSQPGQNLPSAINNPQIQETPVPGVASVPSNIQTQPAIKRAPVEKAPPVKVPSEDEKSVEIAQGEMTETDPDTDDSMEKDSDPSMPSAMEKPSSNGDSDDVSMSPLLQATVESLYAIVLKEPDGDGQCQIGTAWAVTDRHLVTSASVATAIEKSRKQKRTAVAVHPTSMQEFPIKNIRMHINYRQATEAAKEAAELSLDKKLDAAQKMQVRYNIAVVDVSAADPLEAPLSLFTRSLKNTKETSFAMVGYPFENDDDESVNSLTYKSDAVGPPKERHSKKLAAKMGTMPKNSKELGVSVQFGSSESDWSGSPILNKDHKVIGIYGEVSQPKGANGKRPARERGVVSIHHLNEIAPEINLLKRMNDD